MQVEKDALNGSVDLIACVLGDVHIVMSRADDSARRSNRFLSPAPLPPLVETMEDAASLPPDLSLKKRRWKLDLHPATVDISQILWPIGI